MPPIEISIVRAFIEAINRGEPSAISALMTEDHTFIDPGGRTVTGRADMTAGWEAYFQMFPDYQIQIDSILCDNSVVAAFGSATGTYNGKRGKVPENVIKMPAAWKVVVAGGKIKLWQVYADWTAGCKIIESDSAA
jgi:limonene-1,2-epoxide hydrolase